MLNISGLSGQGNMVSIELGEEGAHSCAGESLSQFITSAFHPFLNKRKYLRCKGK